MKIMKTTISALAMAVLLTPQAEARSLDKIFAECGIGAAIFPTNNAAAAVSNIIWDLGTTATSSDISSPESCKGKSSEIAMFIGSTYDKLEVEVAAGKGEYVETLAKMSGKSVAEIRNEFSKVVESKEYATMTKLEKADKLHTIAAF